MGESFSRTSSRLGRTSGVTAFERKLLPRFSHWLFDQVALRKPDFIIPAETKGVRLLDAALQHMRDEHGVSLDPPVIYRTALPYLSSEERAESRVMVVEDAIQTGTNLDRHRDRIKEYGIREIDAVACIGHLDSEGIKRERVETYLNVDDALYTEYVWQLTDLIVARGLPPEIDHNVFELRFPVRFARAWRRLEAMLGEYGTLTVDGPRGRSDEILPLTLHFPTFPDAEGKVTAAHHDGAEKLRLFPDPGADRALIVPVSFPSLAFTAEDARRPLSVEDATAAIAAAVGDRGVGGLTKLLLSEAKMRRPRTVFRALSTCMEVDLVVGLARVLRGIFPKAAVQPLAVSSGREDQLEVEAQPAIFRRLYGQSAGDAVIAKVTEQIEDAFGGSEALAPHDLPDPLLREDPVFLEPEIATVTGEIADRLSRRHAEAEQSSDYNPQQRIGQSMPAIEAELTPESHLLTSRCIDYGLATTALVPYIESEPDVDGKIRVERRYRVSERRRRQRPAPQATGVDTDLKAIDRSAEALSLICSYVSSRGGGDEGGSLSLEKLTWLTAILEQVLADHSIKLEVVPGAAGPQISLLDRVAPVLIDRVDSKFFALEGEGGRINVRASAHFTDLYRDERLALDVDGATDALEDSLNPLISLMTDGVSAEELAAIMAATSMSVDRRLGLTHVRHSIAEALRGLEAPLQLILREENHQSSPGLAERARKAAEQAVTKLASLKVDWSGPLEGRWENPSRSERRLRLLLAAPPERSGIYALASQIALTLAPLAELVARLDLAAENATDAGEPEGVARAVPAEVLEAASGLQVNLMSMQAPAAVPQPPDESAQACVAAARALLAELRRLDSFAAALAGDYRGEKEPGPPQREETTVSALFFDLAGSGYQGRVDDPDSAQIWNDEGLNIAAQWARAFAGSEGGERKGDEIWVEFQERGDAAVLCAALVQCHVAALRSTALQDLTWRFHASADSGTIRPGEVGNRKGACLDRAAKLAKACDADAETTAVYVTEELLSECSAELRVDGIASSGEQLSIDGREDGGAQILPQAIDSAATLRAYTARLAEFVEALAGKVSDLPALAARTEIVERSDVESDQAAAEG